MTRIALAVLLALAPAGFASQSPYAGQEDRGIKSLSAEEIRAYQEGHGMGLAKAAELNHYPGPRHVLELAGELSLTAAQRSSVTTSFERMHENAVRVGREILAHEKALDLSFREGTIEPAALARAVAEIAALQGQLRAVHLTAHLETRSALSPEQVALYDRLRGYGDGAVQHDPARHSLTVPSPTPRTSSAAAVDPIPNRSVPAGNERRLGRPAA